MAQQVEHLNKRLLVGDLVEHVGAEALEIGGDPALPDALGDRGALGLGLAVAVEREEARSHGIGERDLDALGLKEGPDAGNGSAGPDGAGEAGHGAAGLLPDFRPRRVDVGLAVGGVVELVGPDRARAAAAGERLGEAPRVADVVVGILVGGGGDLDELGSGEAEHVLLLLALGLGDDDHGPEPHRGADEGESDAGVSGGPLDDGPAGAQLAARDGGADDVEGGAVLDGLAGVEKLGLSEDLAAGLLACPAEPDERGVPDRLRQVRRDAHVPAPKDSCRQGHRVAARKIQANPPRPAIPSDPRARAIPQLGPAPVTGRSPSRRMPALGGVLTPFPFDTCPRPWSKGPAHAGRRGSKRRSRVMEITQQDVEEVADAISSRFDRDIVRRVTMGLSVDEDFGDCIRIVVYLDEDTTMEDIKGRTFGVTTQVKEVLRDELKGLWPFVGFKKYIEEDDTAA